VDAGSGDDWVIAGGGGDYVQGSSGDDQIDGMGGNDVLEGGDCVDDIRGDGIIKAGFMNTAAASTHGADFIDGGIGGDTLQGGGGSDVVYGGADNDLMWGDASGSTGAADYLGLAYHGNDHMDGEDACRCLGDSRRQRGCFEKHIEFGSRTERRVPIFCTDKSNSNGCRSKHSPRFASALGKIEALQ
jgi:hypothetical protein